MGCPHPDIDCEDCAELVCSSHPQHEPLTATLPIPRQECESCPMARLVAEFIRKLGEEQAWLTGDAERAEWEALHGLHVVLCPLDLEKGAGA